MLIVSNCKTYNTDVNNLVRKSSIQLEDAVRKAWEKKASELASMGIDLNNASLDYTQIDDSTLSQKKMSKEEANLRNSQGQGFSAAHDQPSLLPPGYNPYTAPQTTYPQPSLSQSTVSHPQRARQTAPAPQIQTTMSSSQPLPSKQKMPRSPQHNNYQPPQTNQYSNYTQPPVTNTQPYKPPSYRPTYNPNKPSTQNNYSNSFNSEPAASDSSM